MSGLLLGLALAANAATAAPPADMAPASGQTVYLTTAAPTTITIGAGQLATSLQFALDPAVKQYKLTATALDTCPASQGVPSHLCDVDLFVRHGAQYTLTTTSTIIDLIGQSDYISAGPTNSESIIASYYNPQTPYNGGQATAPWNFVVANADGASTRVQLTLEAYTAEHFTTTINVDFNSTDSSCNTAPWRDPVHGTARKALLTEAATKLAAQIHSAVPINVQACWTDFGGDDGSGVVLAAAGPLLFYQNSDNIEQDYVPSSNSVAGVRMNAPGLPNKHQWYSGPAFARNAGTAACNVAFVPCAWPDIVVNYNSNADAARYYDTTTQAAHDQILSVTMHEMTHGLGFLGLMNTDSTSGPIGQNYFGYDDAFDAQVLYKVASGIHPLLAAGSEAQAALTSGNGLLWSEPQAVNSPLNPAKDLAFPANLIGLYAPNPIQDGSTLSHLDPVLYPQELMGPYLPSSHPQVLGLAEPMLYALGWTPYFYTPPTYPAPLPNNWYDRTHSGHGIDFQLIFRDANFGDLYYVVFYTYDATGKPEYYTALGRYLNGRFAPVRDLNGSSLTKVKYDASKPAGQRITADASVHGEFALDFVQASASKACRSASRTGATNLAVMNWSIGSEVGSWCIESIVPTTGRTTPDYAGHWYGGGNDGGYGMEIFTLADNNATPTLIVYLYYPDAAGNPRWATASTSDYTAGASLDLKEISSGYCRTCAPPAQQTTRSIGTIKLTLTAPTREDTLSGANRVDIQIPGVFSRNNVPITLVSAPPGT